jgi:hypothetical protein
MLSIVFVVIGEFCSFDPIIGLVVWVATGDLVVFLATTESDFDVTEEEEGLLMACWGGDFGESGTDWWSLECKGDFEDFGVGELVGVGLGVVELVGDVIGVVIDFGVFEVVDIILDAVGVVGIGCENAEFEDIGVDWFFCAIISWIDMLVSKSSFRFWVAAIFLSCWIKSDAFKNSVLVEFSAKLFILFVSTIT